MPTPERTSLADITEAARALLEAGGLAQLTMQAVAERVGVRAPSLYKRVRNRDDLIRIVTEATIRDLGAQLDAIPPSGDARADLGELCRMFRAFARSRPVGYGLIFMAGPEPSRPDPALVAANSAPVLRIAGDLAGTANALAGARMVVAWAYGFLSMELAGAFNLGGDVTEAYEFGIARLADALSASAPASAAAPAVTPAPVTAAAPA